MISKYHQDSVTISKASRCEPDINPNDKLMAPFEKIYLYLKLLKRYYSTIFLKLLLVSSPTKLEGTRLQHTFQITFQTEIFIYSYFILSCKYRSWETCGQKETTGIHNSVPLQYCSSFKCFYLKLSMVKAVCVKMNTNITAWNQPSTT